MNASIVKQTAIALAQERGLENISRSLLCTRAGIAPGSFTHITGVSFKSFIRTLAEEGHGGRANTVVERKRIDPALRKEAIIQAVIRLAFAGDSISDSAESQPITRAEARRALATVRLSSLTRVQVATEAGISEGTVSRYFNTMGQLRRAVARRIQRDHSSDER